MYSKKYARWIIVACRSAMLLFLIACNKLVEIPPPADKIIGKNAFLTDSMATAAVNSMYAYGSSGIGVGMGSVYFASGISTVYGGLWCDELSTTLSGVATLEFASGPLTPGNIAIGSSIWAWAYSLIYRANVCLENISDNKGLSPGVVRQLTGECKFMRAFCYSYLVNMFGDVPLILGTDYRINAGKARTPASEIYDQMLSDLKDAQSLFPDAPVSVLRPNRYAATALLARIYLYRKAWDQAETEAGKILGSGKFSLMQDLNKIFQQGSTEGLWQVTYTQRYNAECITLLPSSSPLVVPSYYLNSDLINAFSPSDLRKAAWINAKVVAGNTYSYPWKYKGAPGEQYVMLRLAEQFLIRAEARARQHRVAEAMADVDSVRKRAGLDLLSLTNPGMDETGILAAIEQENRLEYCSEWGHRWYDLRRWPGLNNPALTRADEVLGAIKKGWQSTWLFWPIPDAERLANPNLSQNQGY